MGILSNFIAGAAGAGGEILQRERESGVRVKESQDIARFNDDLLLKREQALEALREERTIRAEGRTVAALRDEESHQASPERIAQLTAAERAKAEGVMATNLALAPKAAEVEAAKFAAGKGTREEAQKEKVKFSLDEYRQKTAAELEAEIKRLNDPKYLQGKAREAAAGRDPTSAALAGVQLKVAQLALKEKEAEGKIPPAVNKLAEAARKEMDVATTAIAKAMAENMFDPKSDNAKSLMAQHSAAAKRFSDLLTPYAGDKVPKDADGGGEQTAAADAAKAVATGRITLEEANKRLVAAGFKPMSAPGGKAESAVPQSAAKGAPPPSGPPVDRLRDQPIGILTPLSTIKEAAAAGNKQAIAYLQRRERGMADTEAAPRTAAEILNQR